MKSNRVKRILAIVLCMVLMLSTGISTMADGGTAAETTSTPENAADQEPAAASVKGETIGTEQEPADDSADQDKATETQEEISTETNAPVNADLPNSDESSVSGVTDLVGGNTAQGETTEQGTEASNESTEQETETVSEATELKQEFIDENGNVAQRVTANLPEGAFQASTSEITMEVNYLDEATENHIKELMTKALPENDILGDYILYDIKFKVNGEVTEPQKEITITFEGSGLHIEDTKKANVFYLDPADPEVQDDKDEIIEIKQKDEMIENLQNAGQSVENIDEYDLSEISVNADGVAEKIQMEGRTSAIYGCYVEMISKEYTYEKEVDGVIVKVYAPEGAFPVLSDEVTMTAEAVSERRYEEIKKELTNKVEEDGHKLIDFLVYDIDLWVNEEKIQPQIPVTVTFENAQLSLGDTDNISGFQVDESDNVKSIDGEVDERAIATVEAEHFTETGIMATAAVNSNVTVTNSSWGIVDNIITDGTLTVNLNKYLQTQIDAAETVKYIWYKSVNDKEFEKVVRKKSGDNFNVADNGEWLNVAYDQGALSSEAGRESVEYKVAVVLNGMDTPIATSDEFSIEYWDELQNGSFEKPVLKQPHNQIKNASNGVIWRTTGLGGKGKLGQDIELINISTKEWRNKVALNYDWYGTPTAADGVQFAELNCEAEGALYQDVLTIRDTELNYWLSHRARGMKKTAEKEKDTMYVVIMPSNIAQTAANGGEIDTQKKLLNYLNGLTGATVLPEEYSNEELGVYIKRYTSSDQKWESYSGTYTPTSYLSRFFFVAGPTASGIVTVGNFLDNVGFSQKLPPANPEEFILQIKKKIQGLSKSDYETLKSELSFEITADDNKAPFHKEIIHANDNGWKWSENADGSYTGVYELTGKVVYGTTYKYTITEKNETVDGYKLESTITVNGVQQDIIDGRKSGTASVTEKSSANFVFVNNYTKNTPPEPDVNEDVPHTKYIDYLGDEGINPDTNLSGDEFYRLYLDVTGIPNVEPDPADVIFVLDVSRSMSFSMKNDEDKVASSDESRIEKLKSATKIAVNALMTGNDNVNVSIIPFHSWVNQRGSNVPLLEETSQNSIIDYIDKTLQYETYSLSGSGAGGTNYQAAFEETKRTLDSLKDNGHKKYVVFVSDGQPTIYTDDNGKYQSNQSMAKAKGKAAAKNLTNDVALNGFYTVSVGPTTGKSYLKDEITPLPIATYKKWLDGTSEAELNNTFSAIAGSITKQIGNVTITDELSDYVDFVYDNDKVDASSIELKVTKRALNGDRTEELNPKNYTYKIDANQKKVTVNFREDYFLERDVIYTISFNVKLTEKAYTTSPTDVGDKGTDYPENETSSEKQGLYSNKQATLTYSRVTDNIYEEETLDYIKPVVQPKVSHTVEKKWNGAVAQAIKVSLKASVQISGESKDVTDEVLSETARGEVRLTAENEWTYKWSNLPQKYYPVLDEQTKMPVDIKYTVEETAIEQETEINKKYETTVKESEDGFITIITNSEVNQWQIIKQSSSAGNIRLKGAEFELKSDKNTYTGISTEDTGIIKWSGINNTSEIEPGTYTLIETKAPTGYALSTDIWTVEIAYKGALPVITDKAGNNIKLSSNSEMVYECTFLNTPVYALPSTGGPGIFLYMIGGVLLMMAAALILYKSKHREVLGN